jgi:hypothetical protein
VKSKLFTPALSKHGDCFVNPPSDPCVSDGFADAAGGGALYPLKLNGSGAPIADRRPAHSGGVGTSEYDTE